MWDRACTAGMVVVAAVALSASFNHHYYALPSEVRALQSEARRVRSSLADLTAKDMPFLEAETSVLRQIAELDNEAARAEAGAVLLQSKLLEIVAALSPTEQSAVPQKIKDILLRVNLLSQRDAEALVGELRAAKEREREENYISGNRTSAASEAPTTPQPAPAEAHLRKRTALQLDELAAEVERWRNSPAQQPGDQAKSRQADEHVREAQALADLRKTLNEERKYLQEMQKGKRAAERGRTMAQLLKKVDEPVPDVGVAQESSLTDFSGKHPLMVVTDEARTRTKFSELLDKKHYGADKELEQGRCNQDFGPGLVSAWRDKASVWCEPRAIKGSQLPPDKDPVSGKRLALKTKITCRQFTQSEHSGPDQLCVLQDGVLNLAQLADSKVTGEVIQKYKDSHHEEQAYIPWQEGTLRGTCGVSPGESRARVRLYQSPYPHKRAPPRVGPPVSDTNP